ncbi:MAG TPA: hypothetical protein VGC97_13010 [Pyrinomonadaceae bacterium]|jgi:hypothetical protein
MKSKDYLSENIRWKETFNPEFPLRAAHDGDELRLRLNDFPAEALYTLFVNDAEIMDIDDLPANWTIKRAQQFVSANSHSD